MSQKFTTRLVTLSAIAATLSISSSVNAAVVYQIDDGQSNAAVGLTSCNPTSQTVTRTTPAPILGDFMWLNSFETKAGGEFIDSIDVVWGARVQDPCTGTDLPNSGLSNESAKVFLYTDTNNDGQLKLLAQEDTIVQPPDPSDPDVFSRIVLKQRQQVSGTFYIAALLPNQREGQFPAALDIPATGTPSRNGQSWIAYSAKPESLTVNPLQKRPPGIADKDYNNDGYYAYSQGYWLLRANGSGAPPKRVPEPTSVVSLVAIATLSAGTLLKRKSKS